MIHGGTSILLTVVLEELMHCTTSMLDLKEEDSRCKNDMLKLWLHLNQSEKGRSASSDFFASSHHATGAIYGVRVGSWL